MDLLHDDIKINLRRLGYLPNYPYHLISEEEMVSAFIKSDVNFFSYFYACPWPSLQEDYQMLKDAIILHLDRYLQSIGSSQLYTIPNWVYSYMMSAAVSQHSDVLDRHDMFVLMNMDNIDDEYTESIAVGCLNLSKLWIARLPDSQRLDRPPTMFGEPHVIKLLRLSSISLEVPNTYNT